MAVEASTSLQRAIDILIALAEAARLDRELGVAEVSRRVGREKSQVSRSLKTLAEAGLVDRDADTLAYRPGWRLFTLAEAAGNQRLVRLATPVLRELVAQVGESAHLSVLRGDHVLTVLSEPAPSEIQVVNWVGRSVPVHSTSSGRALLLRHPEPALRRIVAAARFDSATPAAPRSAEELLARIRSCRHCGYVLVSEEFEPGLVAAAAPVTDGRGQVVAALNVSAPKFRLGRRLDAAGRAVKAAADRLSQLLADPGAPTDRAAESRSR